MGDSFIIHDADSVELEREFDRLLGTPPRSRSKGFTSSANAAAGMRPITSPPQHPLPLPQQFSTMNVKSSSLGNLHIQYNTCIMH